jgi:hypothetical protein
VLLLLIEAVSELIMAVFSRPARWCGIELGIAKMQVRPRGDE